VASVYLRHNCNSYAMKVETITAVIFC